MYDALYFSFMKCQEFVVFKQLSSTVTFYMKVKYTLTIIFQMVHKTTRDLAKATVQVFSDPVRSCPFGIPGDNQTPNGSNAFARILILKRPRCSSSTVYLCLIFSILALFYILYFTEAYKTLLALLRINYANGVPAEHGQPGHV